MSSDPYPFQPDHRCGLFCGTWLSGNSWKSEEYRFAGTGAPFSEHNLHRAELSRENQAPYTVFGFRLWDKVKFDGRECFVIGRRTSGYFALTMLDGAKVTDSAYYKNLKLLETAKNYLTERREGSPPMTEVTGVRAEITWKNYLRSTTLRCHQGRSADD